MREIKFRAWDRVRTRMWTWSRNGCDLLSNFLENPDRFVLMQHTGLSDKNGVGIYEGDLLRTNKDVIYLVYWSNSGACFMVKYPNKWSTQLGRWIYKSLRLFAPKTEIIGDIYQNAELL